MSSENVIHPTAIVGPNVELGSNNYIGPYCVLTGRIVVGDNNHLLAFVVIGQPPQHRKFNLRAKDLEDIGTIHIGSDNVFHEFATIHQPHIASTVVGSDCMMMPYSNLSHDVQVEDQVTIANNVQVGGHCALMRGCFLGFSSVVHQFTVVGSYVMLGMSGVVLENLMPFNKFVGVGPRRLGVNTIGVERAGYSSEQIVEIGSWSERYSTDTSARPTDQALLQEVERYETYAAANRK